MMQWPTDRLARAAVLEKKEYQPEAVVVMLEELKKREVSEEKLPEFVASLPPPLQQASLPERDTLFFPARLDRKQYAIRWFLWIVAVFGAGMLLEFMPALQPAAFIVIIFIGYIYKIVGIDIPRMKNAGLFAPLLVLFVVVPVLNLVLNAILFIAPPKS